MTSHRAPVSVVDESASGMLTLPQVDTLSPNTVGNATFTRYSLGLQLEVDPDGYTHLWHASCGIGWRIGIPFDSYGTTTVGERVNEAILHALSCKHSDSPL